MNISFEEKTGGPAFPRPASIDTTGCTLPDGDVIVREFDGMTLLDWFAGHALASTGGGISANCGMRETVAQLCYDQAEAMLDEKRKRERPGHKGAGNAH